MVMYWKVVNEVIKESDILLEVVDARFIDKTRNIELENKISKAGKVLIYVVNKCDLIDRRESEKIKKTLKPSVFISATERLGTSYLRDEILKRCKKEKIIVGVVGYPNVGKSSVINALKGRAITGTSSLSGFTKGRQLIKLSNRIYLMDTPGVIPFMESNEQKHATASTLSYSQVKDPDLVVIQILEEYPGVIEKYYKVEENNDKEEILEAIAIKLKRLKKKGVPAVKITARIVLRDWQEGKIQKQ